MAMKKAEMEHHRAEYHALMSKARAAKKEGLYREAVDAAFSSWEFIDGMMQYERRYEGREFDGIEGINVVLQYAPLLLDFDSLDKLESLLKDYRRIDKNTSESLRDRLEKGRSLMRDVHRMWDHLERHPGAMQDDLTQTLGGEQEQWQSVAEDWEKMGLLRRTPDGGSYRLALATRMGEVVPAKCSACGAVSMAPKSMLLENTTCPHCKATVSFVFIAPRTSSDAKE